MADGSDFERQKPVSATGKAGLRSDGAGSEHRGGRTFTSDPFVNADAAARNERRSSEGGPDRYSFFVFTMKFVLPGLALVTLAVALMWPILNSTKKTINDAARVKVTPDQIRNFEMLAPKLVGVDENNRPFRIEAKSAQQAGPNADSITLVEPKANITLDSGNWVAISAKQGIYSQKAKSLRLVGSVNVFHDANYTFKTEEATIDLKTRDAWGTKPVNGTAPSGKIAAEGFRVLDKGQRVIFTGKARVILYVNKGDVDGMLSGPADPGSPNGDSPAAKDPGKTDGAPEPDKATPPGSKKSE